MKYEIDTESFDHCEECKRWFWQLIGHHVPIAGRSFVEARTYGPVLPLTDAEIERIRAIAEKVK